MTSARSLLLPVVAAALVLVAWQIPSDNDATRPPSAVAVTQVAYACPAGSVITVASGQVAPGTSSTASVLPDRTLDNALGGATSWRTAIVDGPGVIVRQQGESSGAVGYFAGTAPKSGGGGTVVGSCPGIVDDAWLLGLGSGSKHFSTLILTNLADSPAAVDLTLWGPEGKIDAVNSEGIVVKPFSVRRIRLDSLAAGEAELAVHVHRRRGSLSAIVNDTSTATFRGTEPITATLSPRRNQVVGGLVDGASGRTLLILNPGTATARVDIEAIGPKGTVALSGMQQLRVKASSVRSITVPKAAGASAQALRLKSDHPVSATVRMAPGTKDYAYAEAVPVLSGPTVVPVDLGPGIPTPRLVLTAPRKRATVEVQAFDVDMSPLASRLVTIEGGTTSSVKLEAKGVAYFVLRPRGDVVAAATYAKGDGLSSLALTGAPVTVLGPQVRPVN